MADSVRLSELCSAIVDCPHSTPTWTESGPVVLRSQNIRNGRLDLTTSSYTDEYHFAERTKRAMPSANDLVITREAPMGEVCIIPQDLRCCLGQRMVLLRPNCAKVEPRYLLYALQSKSVQLEIGVNEGTGSTVSNLRIPLLEALPIPYRPLPEQRAIARILGTLDDKIELNRTMSETLEAMARALFKSWFVDFDPVRAKSENYNTCLCSKIDALFPSRLVDTELGEIPEGWSIGSFGDFISQQTERVGNREVVVLSAVASGKLAKSDDHFTKRVYSKETAKYLAVEQWDFAYNPSRINIGSIGMLEAEVLGGVSPVYVVIRPKHAYRWFLEFSIRRTQTKEWINTLASGSVRQSLSYADFASIPCVIPPEPLTQEFNRKWDTINEGIRSNEKESKTLASLRDALLQMLDTGELKLKDVERIIVSAV